jgi:hypothetical protein
MREMSVSKQRYKAVVAVVGGACAACGKARTEALLESLIQVGGGLYLLATAMFAWNIYIAWILITEVSEAG